MSINISKSINNLSINELVNRFQNRAILKTFTLEGKNYDAVIVKSAKPTTPPDLYIFNNDKFVSRTVNRTTSDKNYTVITSACDDGYTTHSVVEKNEDCSISEYTMKTTFSNLDKLREIGLFTKIYESLKGIRKNNKMSVKIRETKEIIGNDEFKTYNIIGKGQNSKLVVNSEDGKISTKASRVNNLDDESQAQFINYPDKVNMNHIKQHIELALKALGINN